jgi:uncharacterized protein
MRLFLAGLLLAALAVPGGASAQDSAKADSWAGKAAAWQEPAIVQDYEPDPAIWLVEDEDTRIYLLGTIHVLPAGFRWRSERLDGILAEADELIVESSGEEAGEQASVAELLRSFGKRPRVSEMLSPASGAKWLALGKSIGVPPEVFDRMPPLLALFGISSSLGSQESQSEREYGVETVLEAEFGAAGKPIGSIESATAVLGSLLAIDESLLIKELERDLSRWDGRSLQTLFPAGSPEGSDADEAYSPLAEEHAWASGQEVDVRDELFGETQFSRMIGTRLLDDRNRAWAGWLEQRLAAPGTILVAVGAGHLAGDNSLQDMLSERGLAAVRVN